MRFHASWVAAGLLLAVTSAHAQTPAVTPHDVPEPAGLYQGGMHGYTPSTIKGGTVLDTKAFVTLVEVAHPILVDVAEKDRKPPTMSKDTPWLPQHRSIPASVWMPGAGNGTADEAFAAAFRTRLATLTDGHPDRPIVMFCHPDCWASYNAAKRAIDLGYTKIYWYAEGMEGWQAEHDTKIIKPDAAWVASLPKELTQ